MFLGIDEMTVSGIEVYKLKREPYRKASRLRPFHAISLRIYGEAKYKMNENTITAKTGDILLVPAYTPYIKETKAEQFYVVHFYSDDPLTNRLQLFHPSDPESLRILFEKMLAVQAQKSTAYGYRIKQLFYQLVGDIENEFALQNCTLAESIMNRVIGIIHENYMKPDFSVASLSQQLNISETYFRRQFQKSMGVSPKKYITELKLAFAKDLLRSGYYSVKEVSERCGFESPYYFSAFIKHLTGISPKMWVDGAEISNNRKIE